MAKQAADHHKKAAEHHEKSVHHHKEASKGYEANQHEKAAAMPTSRMAIANRRFIMGLKRRSPMSNIMGIRSGVMKDEGVDAVRRDDACPIFSQDHQ